MALLDWISPESARAIDEGKIRLRTPRLGDYEAWAALREESRAFLQPWEPTWPVDDLTRAAYRRRIAAYGKDIQAGVAFPFFVFRREDGALTGGVNLNNVRRGVAQTASVGYWCGAPYVRQGLTLAGVIALARFAFDRLQLHRLEAACVPENAPSAALLEQAGFEREGYARAYLKINGDWRDHILFGRVRGAG
jgi:ribosomal-protein-alanine N-acetyltransferase